MTVSETIGGNRFESVGDDTSASTGTTITSSASANTYGSYAELVSSTGMDANWITINIVEASTKTYYALDIAIGAASSEVVIIEKLRMFVTTDAGVSVSLPLNIPAGTRISARLMDATTSARTVSVAIVLTHAPGIAGCGRIEMLDDGGGDSEGLNVESSSTSHTKGSWTAFSSNTGFDYKYFFLAAQPFDSAPTSPIAQLLDVGIGASSSEVVLIDNIFFQIDTLSDSVFPLCTGLYPVNIPEGTRISLRQQSSLGTFQDSRSVKYTLYGLG